MTATYRHVMDWLEWACIAICVVAVAAMTTFIFTGVVMRYGFSLGAQFAEPMSIYFSIQLTFYGAAVCWRAGSHLRLEFIVRTMPTFLQRIAARIVDALMIAICCFMIYFGISLVQTTWLQAYPEFEYIRVGWVYTAIPGGGLVTLLFVLEELMLPPRLVPQDADEVVEALETH